MDRAIISNGGEVLSLSIGSMHILHDLPDRTDRAAGIGVSGDVTADDHDVRAVRYQPLDQGGVQTARDGQPRPFDRCADPADAFQVSR